MQRFTQLFFEIDRSNRTTEKLAALARYFAEAPPADAAWALYFLSGRRIKRAVNTTLLRQWVGEEAGLPLWLVEESFHAVGDLAEALALLLPDTGRTMDLPLHRLVEERLVPLGGLPEPEKRALLERSWREMDAEQRLVWHKLITGEFRVGVARTNLERALATVAGVPQPVMAHRLMGPWEPTEEAARALLSGETGGEDPGRPYPFFLAHPLGGGPETLGERAEWQVEWKWDGIRSQLIRRQGRSLIWSRGEELVTDRFPEIAAIADLLPEGTVVDAEILAWRDERPLPFAMLQKRIGRTNLTPKALSEAPAGIMAYDLLEMGGRDIRQTPLVERRALLEELLGPARVPDNCRVSPVLRAETWEEIAEERGRSRETDAEGLMLKRKSSPYGVGRPRGDWWKWKIEPYTMDAVLIYAQLGNGRRASIYTDYTFGVWKDGALVPVAKAYSGLTDEEIRVVDAWVRRHTRERHGPVRVVDPELVFEIAFEGIQASTRHKAGLAVRFPRIARQRHDKKPEDADTIETLRTLIAVTPGPS
jgi:DNA ligase-1